ncbi:MAG TPA: hypothetical protein VLI92_02900 [Candidatus Saccharimonadales bacterium]|nr:hypothetical protein [Candidatus Saccharimonadales bacterium]
MSENVLQNTVDNNNVADLIENAHSIAVVPSKVAGANAFSAAVGLYYMLLDKQKHVIFIHTGKIPDECEGLITREEIDSTVSQRDLEVLIDYSNTPAAKVSYSTENEVLHLVVSPVSKNFDLSRVKAKISGFEFDLIFIVGAQVIEDLGQTYTELRTEFANAKIVNLDNTSKNQKYGNINIIDVDADSLSSLIFKKAAEWRLLPGKKTAKSLLVGMTYKEARVDSNK